jgi:hypothetical protein
MGMRRREKSIEFVARVLAGCIPDQFNNLVIVCMQCRVSWMPAFDHREILDEIANDSDLLALNRG